jgi:hypothetical protein
VKKNLVITILFLFAAIFFTGCLVSEKISYTVKPDSPTSGLVIMQFYNIKSNAVNDKEFGEDRYNLFDYIFKSEKLKTQLEGQGKDIISRDLYLDGDKLNGKAEYTFKDITKVEGIRFEDGFYFLTLALDDSVISTNGQIIKSKEYKRILWDKTFKVLKFEMYSSGFNDNTFKGLAQFYKPKE